MMQARVRAGPNQIQVLLAATDCICLILLGFRMQTSKVQVSGLSTVPSLHSIIALHERSYSGAGQNSPTATSLLTRNRLASILARLTKDL